MKKYIWTFLFSALATQSMADTNLNCSEVITNVSGDDKLEVCIHQTDDKLNATYQELRNTHKDNKKGLEALKNMQLGWIKMRDSQCLFQSINDSAGGGARTALRCKIEMTIKREEDLSNL